jgi:hypothetical protein
VVLDTKQADVLEDILDEKSWMLHQSRKHGAGPSKSENLINSILDEVVYASAVAK